MKIILLLNHLRYPFSDLDTRTEEAKEWARFQRWAGLVLACALLGLVLASVWE